MSAAPVTTTSAGRTADDFHRGDRFLTARNERVRVISRRWLGSTRTWRYTVIYGDLTRREVGYTVLATWKQVPR